MDIFTITIIASSTVLFTAYIVLSLVLRYRRQLEEKSKLLSDVLSYKHFLEAELLEERRRIKALKSDLGYRQQESRMMRIAS